MLNTLETIGFQPKIINIIRSFLMERKTFLALNGFESRHYQLEHGLPQGSPLSPLLYLIYNNSLLTIPDSQTNSVGLGFVDNIILMTVAVNPYELRQKTQKMAVAQIKWAEKHGTIFDVKKSKWMLFSPSRKFDKLTIDFGD